MIVRIWRTQIADTRDAEYRTFAREKSLPMFRGQPGFAGVLFVEREEVRAVITFWHDLASVEALAVSETYQATVAEIGAAGILAGTSTVELFELERGFLEEAFVDQLGNGAS